MPRSARLAATALLVVAAASGCSTVKDDLGVKSASSPTSAPSEYTADVTQACQAGLATYTTDGARLNNAVGATDQAQAIARIVTDYRDLDRELSRIPAPTSKTATLAVDTFRRSLPDLGALETTEASVRNMTKILKPSDITAITSKLPAGFCATYVQDVQKSLPAG